MSKSKDDNKSFWLLLVSGAALAIGLGYGIWATGARTTELAALKEWNAAEGEKRTIAEADAKAQLARVQELEAALADLEARSREDLAAAQAEADSRMESMEKALADLRAQVGNGKNSETETDAQAGTLAAADVQTVTDPGAPLGLGRTAHPEEITAWDVDVLPDGRGLPEGSGDVFTGEEVFAEHCASCHGDFAEGRNAWPSLAGGFDTLDKRDPVKTVGSYWPYLSTVWDYVHRSMPFGNAGTLSDDDVYAITAYILYSNDLVDDDFTLSRETFLEVEMYNTDGFIVDDRAELEYSDWRTEPCMQDCRDTPAEITRRATDVGVTPADDGSMAESVMEQELAAMGGEEWGHEVLAGSVYMLEGAAPAGAEEAATDSAEPQTATAAPADEAADTGQAGPAEPAAEIDPELVAAGEKVFRKCKACHAVGPGAKNKTGPHLNNIIGRTIGGQEGFSYSDVFQEAAAEGREWDAENLAEFLADPKGYFKGTKMAFAGLRKDTDLVAIVAYLKSARE